MREIVLDTETTGFEPLEGHRIIEVAAVEIVNLMPTGRFYHTLVDPQRDVPPEASRVHGFTRADLDRLHEQLRQMSAELADARRLLARCCTQRDRDGPP